MKRITSIIIGAALSVFLVSGCDEAVTHEPGVYKGMKDPLLAKSDNSDALAERFKLIQTDR